ncbi:MAG: N-acetylglucosamine-6-phosphate deacetylase [Chloroflexi bacterium]|nr:N-acetylglucosamine-6-phosphate deacetylase [Chloroflexota bacterium]
MTQRLALKAKQIVTPFRTIADGVVVLQGERIAQVGAAAAVPLEPGVATRDFGACTIAPGLIDIHAHGYGGHNAGESVETTLEIARAFLASGVTSFLATTSMALTLEGVLEQLRIARAAMKENATGAEILGLHEEGPFISRAGKGPWDRYAPSGLSAGKMARDPSVRELHQMVEAAEGSLRMMSLAPELPGALEVIREMAHLGLIASAAHTTASYQETMAAVEAGMRCATHLYNGMRRQDHREPGVIEAVLTCDALKAEIIGDGLHVLPPAMEMALRCKGVDGIILVTDSYKLAGLPNGTYHDETGREIVKEDDKAYVPGWSLAGSVSPLHRNVRNVVQLLGRPLTQALQLATVNPARLLGVDDRKGSLEPGKDADVVVLDEEWRVRATVCKGRFLYEA